MSVASKNPFALLDAEDSSRPATPAASKAQAAPQQSAQAPAANRNQQQKSRGGPAARGGKYYARGGANKGPRDSAPVNEDVPVPEGKKFEGGRGGRGGARGRGGRGRGGQRFDRHSQTGRTDSQKKVHQGWGGDEATTELKVEEGAVADAAADTGAAADWGADSSAPADWSAPADGDAAVPAAEGDAKPEGRRREREPEEEDNTLTLEQYLAQQKEKDTIVPKLQGGRQANEGQDDAFKDAVALNKNEEEETYFAGKTKSAPKAKAKKEEKVYLEIDARFERPDRGGRGRGRGGDRGGERGGERGRGERRGGRGGRPPRQNGAPAPNVDDQNAFPSLA